MDLSLTGKTRVISPTAAVLYDGVNKSPSRYNWLSLELAEPNLGIPLSGVDMGALLTGSYVFSSTQTFLLCSNQRGERGWVAFNAAEQQFDSEERPDLTNVDMALEWVLYRDPIIINFQLSADYYNNYDFVPGIEGGETPSIPILLEAGTAPGALGTGHVSLSWSTNKIDERAIVTYYLSAPNGDVNDSRFGCVTGDYSFRKYNLPVIDTSVPGTSTFMLTAEDWREQKAVGELVIKALGPIYYGFTNLSTNFEITSSDIKDHPRTQKLIRGTPATTYSFPNPGNNQGGSRLFMAWPMDLNFNPSRFFMNGSALFVQITNADIINNLVIQMDSGAEIPYRVFVTRERYNFASTTLRLT